MALRNGGSHLKMDFLCGPYQGANDILMAISICNQWSVKWDLYASNAKNIAHLSMDLDLNGHIPGERRCTYGIGATPVQERKKQASEFFNQVSFLWKMLNIKVYGVSGDFIVRDRCWLPWLFVKTAHLNVLTKKLVSEYIGCKKTFISFETFRFVGYS